MRDFDNFAIKNFEILTLFPEVFPGTLDISLMKRSRGVFWDYKTHDLRKYGIGKHSIVDDEVFSSLPGMLIRPDVIENALEDLQFSGKLVFMSPRGKMLQQPMVEEFAASSENILILCGRYEGVDQRAIDYFKFEEISVGNYIVCGGETPALIFMESIIRKIPGVIGNDESFKNESFSVNWQDNEAISEPRYTRPAIWTTKQGDILEVDEILRNGDHKKIELFQKNGRKSINKR